MKARQLWPQPQRLLIFLLGLRHLAENEIVFSKRLVGPRGIRMSCEQSINRVLGEQAARVAKVVQQIRVAGTLRERCREAGNSFGQLVGFNLSDSERVQRAHALQMRNRLRRVSLRQKRITQKLVSHWKVRAELQSAFQRSDRRAVVVLFHIGAAEIYERIRQVGVAFCGFAKLRDFCLDPVLFARLKARLQMLHRVGSSGLPGKPRKQKKMNHERSGSRTERNWSARTSLRTCFTPDGQKSSTVAFSEEPSPKCRRLSLAQR